MNSLAAHAPEGPKKMWAILSKCTTLHCPCFPGWADLELLDAACRHKSALECSSLPPSLSTAISRFHLTVDHVSHWAKLEFRGTDSASRRDAAARQRRAPDGSVTIISYLILAAADNFHHKYPDDQCGEEFSENSRVWQVYHDEALRHDRAQLARWTEGLDSLLLAAGIFSAVTSALLALSYQACQPNYNLVIVQLLHIIASQQTGESPNRSTVVLSDLSVALSTSASATWTTALWMISLLLCISTALLGILAKHWLSENTSLNIPAATLRDWARQRQHRLLSLRQWHITKLIEHLGLLLHVALLPFLCGIILFAVPMGLSVLLSVNIITLPLLFTSSLMLLSPLIRSSSRLALLSTRSPPGFRLRIPDGRHLVATLPQLYRQVMVCTRTTFCCIGFFYTRLFEVVACGFQLVAGKTQTPSTMSDSLDAAAIHWLMTNSTPNAAGVAIQAIGAIKPDSRVIKHLQSFGVVNLIIGHIRSRFPCVEAAGYTLRDASLLPDYLRYQRTVQRICGASSSAGMRRLLWNMSAAEIWHRDDDTALATFCGSATAEMAGWRAMLPMLSSSSGRYSRYMLIHAIDCIVAYGQDCSDHDVQSIEHLSLILNVFHRYRDTLKDDVDRIVEAGRSLIPNTVDVVEAQLSEQNSITDKVHKDNHTLVCESLARAIELWSMLCCHGPGFGIDPETMVMVRDDLAYLTRQLRATRDRAGRFSSQFPVLLKFLSSDAVFEEDWDAAHIADFIDIHGSHRKWDLDPALHSSFFYATTNLLQMTWTRQDTEASIRAMNMCMWKLHNVMESVQQRSPRRWLELARRFVGAEKNELISGSAFRIICYSPAADAKHMSGLVAFLLRMVVQARDGGEDVNALVQSIFATRILEHGRNCLLRASELWAHTAWLECLSSAVQLQPGLSTWLTLSAELKAVSHLSAPPQHFSSGETAAKLELFLSTVSKTCPV